MLYSGPFVAERYASVGSFVASRPESDLDPTVRDIILGATKYSAVDVFNAEYRLQDLRSTVNKIFEGIDALLLPTAPSIYRIEEIRRNPIQLNSQTGHLYELRQLTRLMRHSGARPACGMTVFLLV